MITLSLNKPCESVNPHLLHYSFKVCCTLLEQIDPTGRDNYPLYNRIHYKSRVPQHRAVSCWFMFEQTCQSQCCIIRCIKAQVWCSHVFQVLHSTKYKIIKCQCLTTVSCQRQGNFDQLNDSISSDVTPIAFTYLQQLKPSPLR